MNLLTVLPFSAADAVQAEKLCDYIALLNDKKPRGHCLVVCAPDTHKETHLKVKIAAEAAFASVELLEIGWLPEAPTSKAQAINHLFGVTAAHVMRAYQWPFVWLEPDAVPLKSGWLEELSEAYHSQPKRYLGAVLADATGNRRALSRVAVYPRNASADLQSFCSQKAGVPFDLNSGNVIIPRATKTKLIQACAFTGTTGHERVRFDAVLLHHDKESLLLTEMAEKLAVRFALETEKPVTIQSGQATVPQPTAVKPKAKQKATVNA